MPNDMPASSLNRRLASLCLLAAALMLGASAAQAQSRRPTGSPQLNLPRTTLTAGMHRIDAQVAATHAQRQIGLMHRTDMPQHEGMLFVFEQPAVQCFWMKNTLIPLTAAFVLDDGTIANLADMQPLDERSHCSTQPVRYVLEMNQGWFAARHLKAGNKLGGAPFKRH
jgi:uncharacterized membrane protein (UPF0127 family)